MAPLFLLTLYFIQPQIPIDWSSPRTLSVTTAINSAGKDYAPIGHFAVEVQCARPNRYGINHVLTGMERKDKAESRRITLKEGLGLGSLTHSFEGRLQSAKQTREEIERARRDRRLKVMQIPTTEARCDQMMQFLENWVEAGSYTVYGGGKRTAEGEGAGCADFAMEFFKIATGAAVPEAWTARISVPTELVGGNGRKVNFVQLLSRGRWARTDEAHMEFAIADTDRVHRALERTGGRRVEYQWTGGISQDPPAARRSFSFHYPVSMSSRRIFDMIAPCSGP